jgi:hypothetical protein
MSTFAIQFCLRDAERGPDVTGATTIVALDGKMIGAELD